MFCVLDCDLRQVRFRFILQFVNNQFVSSIGAKIKKMALETGFDLVGIAPAEALRTDELHLREWLGRGNHGEMAWMEREPEKRADPRTLFPGARSVVAVALNYFTPHDHVDGPNMGKISRYAWGDDYHEIVKQKLHILLDLIRAEFPEANGKVCVDTAPIMDKAWAARSGIGWIGKHSNVITMELGSWVFLGEIILDIDLGFSDGPATDHCGSCTACIDACPTGAIVEPYVVDSNKCISYATIELRSDDLPTDIETNLNGWFYGCDICQDVCPWNRFEKPSEEPRFEPRFDETAVDLDTVLAYTPETYAARFKKSAVKRAKLPGLRRNAAALKKSNKL